MRVLPHVMLAACATLAGACGPDPCALDPAYGGDATDEVWRTLDDARDDAKEDDDAASIERPSKDQSLKASDGSPTFAWSSPLKLALAPAHPAAMRRAPGAVDRAIDALSRLVVPVAHAHEAPVTSDAYLVDVTVPGQKCTLQAVTTELEAELLDEAWQIAAAAAGQDGFSVTVFSAYLDTGRIAEGPFESKRVAFEVK